MVDAKAFNKIFEITKLYKDAKKVYVASAFNGITDLLLKAADMLHDEVELDKILTIIEKKHIDVIENIFEDDSPHYHKAKDWVDSRISELEDVFSDILEFGLEPYYIDYVSSFGEILSTYILNEYLNSQGLDSLYIAANKIIITNDNFNNAYPLYELTNNRIKNKVIPLIQSKQKDFIICVTGFIGRNKIGYITTLGRGGSDYTATILARSIYETGADKDIKVILWKDVDGLLAINPKFVKDASLIKFIDYNEAKEIANFGAKVLHPKCLEALETHKIPLEIRNFENPDDEENFTKVSEKTDKEEIKGISTLEDAAIINITSGSLVDVPGVLAQIFKTLAKQNISVSLVSQSASEVSTSFVVKDSELDMALQAFKDNEQFREFFTIRHKKIAIINVTGTKILENKSKARIFDALEKKGINVMAISQSFQELNLSIVIKRSDLLEAIHAIHQDLCTVIDSTMCETEP